MNVNPQVLRLPTVWVAAIALIAASLWPLSAQAQGRKIIRDAEIENTIRAYSTPLFQAAGLSPSAVDIILIDDRAGGQHGQAYDGDQPAAAGDHRAAQALESPRAGFSRHIDAKLKYNHRIAI